MSIKVETRSKFEIQAGAIYRYCLWHWLSDKWDLITVSEFPKSGGTWLCRLLSDILDRPFPENRTHVPYRSIVHGHFLYKVNFNRPVCIFRDGRDVMVSWYHHLIIGNASTYKSGADRILRELDFEDPMMIRRNLAAFIDYMFTEWGAKPYKFSWGDFVDSYLDRENVGYIRYEDMLEDTSGALRRLLSQMDIDIRISQEKFDQIVRKHSFENVTGRAQGDEDKSSFLRKGVSGDWKNYFTLDAAKKFDCYAGDKLITLGYEQNNQWVRNVG